MDRQSAEKLLDEHLDKLGEFFESVQLIVTDSDKDGTLYCARGRGNFYARKGSVQQFLENDQHDDAAQYIGEVIKKEED